jgi:hypothetical protein
LHCKGTTEIGIRGQVSGIILATGFRRQPKTKGKNISDSVNLRIFNAKHPPRSKHLQ